MTETGLSAPVGLIGPLVDFYDNASLLTLAVLALVAIRASSAFKTGHLRPIIAWLTAAAFIFYFFHRYTHVVRTGNEVEAAFRALLVGANCMGLLLFTIPAIDWAIHRHRAKQDERERETEQERQRERADKKKRLKKQLKRRIRELQELLPPYEEPTYEELIEAEMQRLKDRFEADKKTIKLLGLDPKSDEAKAIVDEAERKLMQGLATVWRQEQLNPEDGK